MITIHTRDELFLRKNELNNLIEELSELNADRLNPFAERQAIELQENIAYCRDEIRQMEFDLRNKEVLFD